MLLLVVEDLISIVRSSHSNCLSWTQFMIFFMKAWVRIMNFFYTISIFQQRVVEFSKPGRFLCRYFCLHSTDLLSFLHSSGRSNYIPRDWISMYILAFTQTNCNRVKIASIGKRQLKRPLHYQPEWPFRLYLFFLCKWDNFCTWPLTS